MISIHQLSKKYKSSEFYSVKNFSLEIQEKEIFGLLGPNGAGKTTLIAMLSGLVAPTSGKFSIKKLSYSKNKRKIQKLIGIVPQEYALYPTMTAYENLIYFGKMYGLRGKELHNSINNFLDNLGLIEFADKKIQTYSGGMKRRINLIASILHSPEVLFLDEPTVGVDVQSKNVIIDYLKELNSKGTTIIYTSHHLNEAEHFCNHVGIIDNGELKIEGKPQELITQNKAGNLEELFLSITGKGLRDYA